MTLHNITGSERSGLRILPDDLFAEARERYRDLASQDRPGDINEVEFDAREQPRPIMWLVVIALAALTIISGALV